MRGPRKKKAGACKQDSNDEGFCFAFERLALQVAYLSYIDSLHDTCQPYRTTLAFLVVNAARKGRFRAWLFGFTPKMCFRSNTGAVHRRTCCKQCALEIAGLQGGCKKGSDWLARQRARSTGVVRKFP